MKAYLIDPQKRTIEAVETDGRPESVKALVGAETLDSARINAEYDRIWVDDSGLERGRCYAFHIRSYGMHHPFSGKAAVFGITQGGRGNHTAPARSIEWLRSQVVWLGEINVTLRREEGHGILRIIPEWSPVDGGGE